MIFSEVDLSDLPENSEEAFVEYEKIIRERYHQLYRHDRDQTNIDGEYVGKYEPERSYMNAILAFIDEYSLDIKIPDISDFRGSSYYDEFLVVMSTIEYAVGRLSLRRQRILSGSAGTIISIEANYKTEIGELLQTIRKIVIQEVSDIKKRDAIMTKISLLQSEVDREQTTVDALFGRMIDLSQTIRTCTDELEPLFKKVEKLKKLFWDRSEKVKLLPKQERQKLIPEQSAQFSNNDADNDFPF